MKSISNITTTEANIRCQMLNNNVWTSEFAPVCIAYIVLMRFVRMLFKNIERLLCAQHARNFFPIFFFRVGSYFNNSSTRFCSSKIVAIVAGCVCVRVCLFWRTFSIVF